MIPSPILKDIEETLQLKVLSVSSISGGCIHQAFQLTTEHPVYSSLFLKMNTRDKIQVLQSEYEGLQLLAQTNRINIPQIYEFREVDSYVYLLMEYLPPALKDDSFWQSLAEQLVALHRYKSDYFGLPTDNYIGSLPQRNRLASSWHEFYVENRLLPLVKWGREQGYFDSHHVSLFERLAYRCEAFFPEEPPSLLHGDLWSGNVHASRKGAYFLDPAPYFGHREMDIAFSTLFGGFSPVFYEVYQELFPLEPGFEERTPLYNLYYLLVHLLLFGQGYFSAVVDILKRYA